MTELADTGVAAQTATPTDAPLIVDGLEVRVGMRFNPYSQGIISDQRLYEMLVEAATELASRIARRHKSGRYQKKSFALIVMDPTMPINHYPTPGHVWAVVLVGPDSRRLLKNAWKKIVGHMEHGQDVGIAVFLQRHRKRGGMFNWGQSICDDGVNAGGSGLNQIQDKSETRMFVADVCEAIGTADYDWEQEALQAAGQRPSWLTLDGMAPDGDELDIYRITFEHGTVGDLTLALAA